MRGLQRLIPDDLRNSLNSSPITKWVALVVFFLVGLALAYKGIDGIKTKKITGKNGKTYEGGKAQFIGAVFVVSGLLAVVMAAVFAFVNE